MKLLIVDRYYYPDLQATAVLLTDLAGELAKTDSVTVVCGPPSKFRAPKNDNKTSAVRVITLPAFQCQGYTFVERFLNYASFLAASFFSVLFFTKQDVILVQSSPPLLSFFVCVAARIRGFPVVYVCQDLFPQTAVASGYLKNRILIALFRWMHKHSLAWSKKVVAIGRDMIRALIEEGVHESKLTFISNWANPEEIRVLLKQDSIAAKHGLLDSFVLMHSGNFGLVQDFDLMLRLADTLRTRPEVKMVFVGGGALRNSVMSKAKKMGLPNVLFLDFEERPKLSEVLACADVHIISLKQGMKGFSVPSKMYSLLLSGRPIFGFVEAGTETARLIQESDCGIVLAGCDVREIAEHLAELISRKDRIVIWGENARYFASKMDFQKSAFLKYRKVLLDAAQKEKTNAARVI